MILSGRIEFLLKFIKSSKNIGSITPSSAFLAKAMIKPIDWKKARSIVELGAGTGVFTKHIEQLKYPHCRGIIFEKDEEMVKSLMKSYPGLYFHSRAEDIYAVLQQIGLSKVDCILSGLPFATFPQPLRDQILDGVTRSLRTGGLFIQFQYSLQMKNQLHKRFKKIDLKFVLLNIPPAFVYYCYK